MCISHFSKGSMWAKDPLSSRRRFIQSFPNERKNAFPCKSGEGWEATSSGPSGHLPLSGEGFAWCCAIMRTERKACPCEPVTGVTGVAPSGGHLSHRERQDPHGYLPFRVFLGAVYSISREMSSVYLRKKSGPLSSKSSTDTPSSSSAWQAGSSRGRPKSLCIRRIR